VPDENTRLVYSTDGGRIAPPSRLARAPAPTPAAARAAAPADGFVRVRRETAGRRGKTVTTITGLPNRPDELDALLKVLKQHCGAGGTREGAVLEIQGDHRARLQAKLTALGHNVKLAGG